MKWYSLKFKLMFAFMVSLILVTLLNALQTAYVINRRGKEEAFTHLSHQLTLFKQELNDIRETQIAVAMDASGDDKNLSDLAILYAQALKLRQQSSPVMERTFGLNKAISLNRLQLILDSARFSSAAIYLEGELSHYVTGDVAGMMIKRDGQNRIVGTRRQEAQKVSLLNWRTWDETALPVLVSSQATMVDRVTASVEFPAKDLMVLQVMVPIQGQVRESFLETIVENMAIAVPKMESHPQTDSQTAKVFGMFIFSQTFDTAFLRNIARQSGMAPLIFSPDGQHVLQLNETGHLPSAPLSNLSRESILTQTITLDKTSYYQAFTTWQIHGKPVLILGSALSRDGTLETIRQTITRITGTAVLIFLIMGTLGYLVLQRMIAPITTLTTAVLDIGFNRARELNSAGKEMTLHFTLGRYLDRQISATSRDEIGALTNAFNAMAGQLHNLIGNLETEVQRRTAQLEASNKELEAFAYSVSHDLRAPVRHIDGFLELLQEKAGTALDEQSQHYMDTISEAARKMGHLIDGLLSFSRMGRNALSFQQVELGELVRNIIQDLEPDTAHRTIDWHINDLPAVYGDTAMLRMVLDNLISNAVKFTRPRDQARIDIGSLPSQDAVTIIYVRDNGAGFDMAYADKLFNVFQRLHRSDEFEGTGIGLANVHRIITRHGGRTWADGKLDQGATFYFSLPLN